MRLNTVNEIWRKWFTKYQIQPVDRKCVQTDSGCEESSVLAAGAVSEAADVRFIDGVQE